jgi:hypothetical protein
MGAEFGAIVRVPEDNHALRKFGGSLQDSD